MNRASTGGEVLYDLSELHLRVLNAAGALSAMLHLAEVLYQGGEMSNGETQNLSKMLYHLGCKDVVVQLLAKGVSADDVLEVVRAINVE